MQTEYKINPCDCTNSDVIVGCDNDPVEPLWVVQCKNCDWHSSWESTKYEAIVAWNKEHEE